MVLISLKSQYVSLMVTILSFFCELSILFAFLEWNNYHQCKRLTQQKTVNVRHLRRYGRMTAVAAGIIFLILEIVASFLCEPGQVKTFLSHPCIKLEASTRIEDNDERFIQTTILEDRCQLLEETTTSQLLGNYSLEDQQLRCSKNALYKFKRLEEVKETLPEGTVLRCVPKRQEEQLGEFCVFAFYRNRSIFFSEALKKSTAEMIEASNGTESVLYLRTEILFEGAVNLSALAKRAAYAFSQSETDPSILRRLVFLGARKTTCPFVDETKDVTKAPLSLVYVLGAVWTLSMLLFVISIVSFRRRIFFNFADPLHWALYTRQRIENRAERNPVLSYEYEGEDRILFVSEQNVKTTDADANTREIKKMEDD